MRRQPKQCDSVCRTRELQAHNALDLAVELKVQAVSCCARREALGPLRAQQRAHTALLHAALQQQPQTEGELFKQGPIKSLMSSS